MPASQDVPLEIGALFLKEEDPMISAAIEAPIRVCKCEELAWLLLQLEKLEGQQSSGPAWLAECHEWHKDI